ncbi:MAG: homoserine O-acetyltransferase [Acidimicrobiales bacterium]
MTPPPASYWRPGDEPGHRTFVTLTADGGRPFLFESGGQLDSVTVAYETWGELNASRSNAVLVLHALSADAHAYGPEGRGHLTSGWWNGVIGPGLGIDTDHFFVVCPNVLGACQGTTGPSSLAPDGRAFGSRFPVITIRDQVDVEVAFSNYLEIDTWAGMVGGSMGAMRALEWAIGQPNRVQQAIVLSVGAASTADEIALCSLQIRAIKNDPHFNGGDYYDSGSAPIDGMAIARGLGQFTYRTGNEFEIRFGRELQEESDIVGSSDYAIESYLKYQGAKLGRRFDPNSYIVLSDAMNHHDVGRGRGGIATALGSIQIPVTVAGILSDRLYPLELQEQLVKLIPDASPLKVITSDFGHDGFLLEAEQVGNVIASALRD